MLVLRAELLIMKANFRMSKKSRFAKCFVMECSEVMGRHGHIQEGMELQEQGRGLCISFSWLINDKTLIGAPNIL